MRGVEVQEMQREYRKCIADIMAAWHGRSANIKFEQFAYAWENDMFMLGLVDYEERDGHYMRRLYASFVLESLPVSPRVALH